MATYPPYVAIDNLLNSPVKLDKLAFNSQGCDAELGHCVNIPHGKEF